jgi:ribosomal protein L40E
LDAKFCKQCGTSLQVSHCTQCGANLSLDAKFCAQCGKAKI